MTNEGWIKLYRKISHSPMYKALNSKQRDVMIQCLILANHKQREWQWGADVFECQPGQFITSINSLQERCAKDVSIQNIRKALEILEKWQFLTDKSTNTGRLITICNWDIYQGVDFEEQQSNQQTANKQLTPNKNVKNVKEEYDRYILSTKDEKYHAFVEFLFGDNELNHPLKACLSLDDQITPERFKTLMGRYPKETIKAKIMAMENKKDLLKNYTGFYWTLNIWCKGND
jgi:hypothetical protein